MEKLLLLSLGLFFASVNFLNWHLRDVWVHYLCVAILLIFLICGVIRRAWGILLLVAAIWFAYGNLLSINPYTHSLIASAERISLVSHDGGSLYIVEFSDGGVSVVTNKNGEWLCLGKEYANKSACRHIAEVIKSNKFDSNDHGRQ